MNITMVVFSIKTAILKLKLTQNFIEIEGGTELTRYSMN